jgi:hypothetical protein
MVDAPLDLRITTLNLPGKTTSPLGPPIVAGCAIWVTSGENGGGFHRIDSATGAVTNANPAEVPFDIATDGNQLWAIGQPKNADAVGHPVLYQLDPATGATIREVPLSVFGSEVTILDGRAWIAGWRPRIEVIDLATGDHLASVDQVASRDIDVGAGGVWSGLARIDPDTFEVTELATTFSANDIVFVGDRMYGIDQEHGQIAQIDPVTGAVLTSVQVDNWSAGLVAVEGGSIWILRYTEPPVEPLKLRKTDLIRIDGATGQIAERIPIDVVYPVSLSATEGSLWLVDQPERLRHGFIRIELPASR